jgi:hypothetical protein
MAKVYELQNAAQSNQLNRLKMDEYTRGVAEDTEIKNALRNLDKNSPTYEQDRFNAYALKGIEGVKAYAATKKEEAAAEEHAAGTSGKKLSNTEASIKLAKSAQNEILDYPSEAMLTSWFEDAKRKKVFNPETLANIERFNKIVLSVPAPIDPATGEPDFTARRQAITRLQLEAKDRLSKPGQRDVGGSVQDIMTDPVTGKTIVTGTAKKTATPGEVMTNTRERERISQGNRRDVVSHQQVSEDGTVTNFNKFGEVINTVKGAGKPSAQFTKTKEQTKRLNTDLNLAITELDNATKDGGLIDQSTGSGLGKAMDVTRAFVTGGAGEGAIAGAKLGPIADLALKMVPRFEGPQSDKDTQSYKEAAGQLANTAIPNEIRKQAGRTVLRLMKNRKNQFVTQDMAQEGVVPSAGGDVDSSNPLLR